MPKVVVGRDAEDLKRYEERGTILLGKHIVGKGEEAHLTSPILMDVLRPHCILICGKRGSGKSFTMGVIAEEIMKLDEELRKKLAVVIIDTQGIYWSMREQNEKDVVLLDEWDLKPRGFQVSIYVPQGHVDKFERAGVAYEGVYSIEPNDLSAEDWALAFGIDLNSLLGVLLGHVVRHMRGRYMIEEMIEQIYKEERFNEETKLTLESLFRGAEDWGIFSKKGIEASELLKPGKVSVLDVSLFTGMTTGWSVRSLLVGLIAKKIYEARVVSRRAEELSTITGGEAEAVPYAWIMMDEAHNFVPADATTAATDPLLMIVSQGRQPGISTVFITQTPNRLHPTVIAQSDLVVSHRLTSKADIDALRSVMQTYMLYDIEKYINELPRLTGVALILDDNSERLYSIRVRPRQSWHAGGSPVAATV